MSKLTFLARSIQGITLLCSLIQIGVDASYENIVATLLILGSTCVLYEYLERSQAIVNEPISSLMLIGFNWTTTWVAFVAQTLSGLGVVHLLRTPMATFGILSGLLLLAIGTHWVYRHLAATMALRQWVAQRVYCPLGALEAPHVWAVWAMASVGALATLRGYAEFGDVNGKLFQAMGFLQWLPFAIPLYYKKWGRDYCDMRVQTPLLIAFVVILAAIGLVRNARQLMLIGPFQGALTYLLMVVHDKQAVTRKTMVQALGVMVAGLIGISALADFTAAMAVARDKRETLSGVQIMKETFAVLKEPEKLDRYRTQLELAAKLDVYDEAYLRNPMLARLSETKFHDNMLFYALNFGDGEAQQIWAMSSEKLLLALPQPVLDALNIKIDKARNMFSMGDYYRYLNEGEVGLGGFATGSIWADMLSMFGVWMPFVAVGLFLLVFLTFDSLSFQGNLCSISPVVLGSTYIIFEYGLGAESLVGKVAFLLRDWPQKLVLYLLVYQLFRLFSSKRYQA